MIKYSLFDKVVRKTKRQSYSVISYTIDIRERFTLGIVDYNMIADYQYHNTSNKRKSNYAYYNFPICFRFHH